MAGELSERVGIVTGAGQGIGLGIARSLARRGAALVVNDLVAERLAPVVSELRSLGAEALGLQGDVTKADDVAELVAKTLERHGRLDILVNNAGAVHFASIMSQTEDDWDRMLDVNAKSVFLCCSRSLPTMIQARRGSIVNVSSVGAFRYTAPHVPYAASKAAVTALTRDLAVEVAPYGIRVNAVAPGAIDTPLTAEALTPDRRASLVRAIPLGRFGTPEDVGEAVAFLAGDGAAFITGTTLMVTGGVDLGIGAS